MGEGDIHWIRTVGAPSPGDPRDGELHQFSGALPEHFDLEPWDDASQTGDAHYVRSTDPPVTDDEGRTVWIFEYKPG